MNQKFQVGDVLRVREWDDMAAEFGVTSEGDIPCLHFFTRSMKKFCGQIFTVHSFTGSTYIPVEDSFKCYKFSESMLEYANTKPYSEREIKAATKQQLNRLYGR